MKKDYDWSHYNKRYRNKLSKKAFNEFKDELIQQVLEKRDELNITDAHIIFLLEFIKDFEQKEVLDERKG